MARIFAATPSIDVARFFVPDMVAPKALDTPQAGGDFPITLKQLRASSRIRAWLPRHLVDEFLSD